jgi:hypothetical protein
MKYQDAVVELSEHGIVLIVEETGCLQAKVYLQKEVIISNLLNMKENLLNPLFVCLQKKSTKRRKWHSTKGA